MSTKTLESSETRSMQVEARVSTPSYRSTLLRSTEFSSAVYRDLAAINTTWSDFIKRRIKEDLALPGQLGECKSFSAALRVCGAYWRTAVAQYQNAFAQYQQIALNLASGVSAASLVPVRIPAPQYEHTARSPDRVARDCFP